MKKFLNSEGYVILRHMVKAIQDNKVLLGDVDGLIGDGDHGMNMNKGFTTFWDRNGESNLSFSDGLFELGNVLLGEIGGSMGPIYGTIFMEMSDALTDDEIGVDELASAFEAGRSGLFEIIDARVGDKTLVDVLSPVCDFLRSSADNGAALKDILSSMKAIAENGKESTKALEAKYGRASRLGARSIGVLDAGATSCCIIIQAMASGIQEILGGSE